VANVVCLSVFTCSSPPAHPRPHTRGEPQVAFWKPSRGCWTMRTSFVTFPATSCRCVFARCVCMYDCDSRVCWGRGAVSLGRCVVDCVVRSPASMCTAGPLRHRVPHEDGVGAAPCLARGGVRADADCGSLLHGYAWLARVATCCCRLPHVMALYHVCVLLVSWVMCLQSPRFWMVWCARLIALVGRPPAHPPMPMRSRKRMRSLL